MQPVNPSFPALPGDGGRRARRLAGAVAVAGLIVGGTANLAAAACPWIVQPYAQSVPVSSETPTFDIVFDGLGQSSKVFYGFTVASLDLAWQLTSDSVLPALDPDGRRLEMKATAEGAVAYQLSPDSIQPHTIYLVAADGVVEQLEEIDARIDPARPIALSQLMPRYRGGSDWSGPMPHRSLPGFEIAGVADANGGRGTSDQNGTAVAAVQICAYQVAMR
jgi:hypothetical protein